VNNHLGVSVAHLTPGQVRIAKILLDTNGPVRSRTVAEAMGYKHLGGSNESGTYRAQRQLIKMVELGLCTQHPWGSLEHQFLLTLKGKAAIQRTRNAAFIREFSKSESCNEDR
jgi:hypothetical protein